MDASPEVQQPSEAVWLEAVLGTIAHLRLSRGVPECVRGALATGHFCTVVQEPGGATAWVPRSVLSQHADGMEDMDQGRDWCALRVGRWGSSKNGLRELAPPGTANVLCTLLTEASIHVRLVSAFGAEMLLVREEQLPDAAAVLADRGHALCPAARVCAAVPWRAQEVPHSDSTLARQLAGAWSLMTREEPLGTVAMEYTEGDGPLRLQSPGGVFVELRLPAEGGRGTEHQECSFAGRCHIATREDKAICTQLRAVDFQPPRARPAQTELKFGADSLEAVGFPEAEHRELWARLKDGDTKSVVSLELEAEAPPRKTQRCGFWVFVGGRFARVLGPPHGSGLVGGTCCRSLQQLQKLKGSLEMDEEVSEHYEAVSGFVERPGLLRVKRVAWQAEKANAAFYSATDKSTGTVEVGKTSVKFTTPSGRKETWRILEWSYDPFTGVAAPDGASSSPTRARSQSTGSLLGGDAGPPMPLVSPSHSPTAEAEEEDAGEATDVVGEEPEATRAAEAKPPLAPESDPVTVAHAVVTKVCVKAARESTLHEPHHSVVPSVETAREPAAHKRSKDKTNGKDKKDKKHKKLGKDIAKDEEVVVRPDVKVKDKKKNKKKKKHSKDKKQAKAEAEAEAGEEEEEEPTDVEVIDERAAEEEDEPEEEVPIANGRRGRRPGGRGDEVAEDISEVAAEEDEETAAEAMHDEEASEPAPPSRSRSREVSCKKRKHSGKAKLVPVKAKLVPAKDRRESSGKDTKDKTAKKEHKASRSEGRREAVAAEPPPAKTRDRKPKDRGSAIQRLLGVVAVAEGRQERRSVVAGKSPVVESESPAPRGKAKAIQRERSRSRDVKKRNKARA